MILGKQRDWGYVQTREIISAFPWKDNLLYGMDQWIVLLRYFFFFFFFTLGRNLQLNEWAFSIVAFGSLSRILSTYLFPEIVSDRGILTEWESGVLSSYSKFWVWPLNLLHLQWNAREYNRVKILSLRFCSCQQQSRFCEEKCNICYSWLLLFIMAVVITLTMVKAKLVKQNLSHSSGPSPPKDTDWPRLSCASL